MDLAELEALARERMAAMAYDYYAGGAESETTLRNNVAAWDDWCLRPFVLRDVTAVSTATTVLGTDVTMPILVAPTAYHRLAHDEGECATARGAAAAGTLMTVSTLATCPLEDVAAAAPDAPRWFQLYVFDDTGYANELVERAAAAGYKALVLTVDAPVLGYRARDERNGFRLPDHISMANVPRGLPPAPGGSGLAALFGAHDKRMTFDQLGALRERADIPLIVKGVHRGDDAARCVDAGADAVIVSNHGGRQVDCAVPTAHVLPEVVEAVGGRCEVYVDGGIRRGTDVLTALALGARAVLLGRPVLWSLACGGADGVRDLLVGLDDSLRRTMTMCGVTDATAVPADLVAPLARLAPSPSSPASRRG